MWYALIPWFDADKNTGRILRIHWKPNPLFPLVWCLVLAICYNRVIPLIVMFKFQELFDCTTPRKVEITINESAYNFMLTIVSKHSEKRNDTRKRYVLSLCFC